MLTNAIGLFLFACMTYGSYVLARDSFRFGDVTVDIGFPRGITQGFMVIGSVFFFLQLVISTLFELGIIRKPELYDSVEEGNTLWTQ